MEDAATAEICRSQIWQWIHSGATLSDGTPVTADLVRRIVAEELVTLGDTGDYRPARETFEEVAFARRLRGVPDAARVRADALKAPIRRRAAPRPPAAARRGRSGAPV